MSSREVPNPDRTQADSAQSHSEESAIEALAQLESGLLSRLRSAVQKQQEHQKALDAREAALSARETEIGAAHERLTSSATTIAQRETQLEEKQAKLDEAAGAMAKAQSELAELRQSVEELREAFERDRVAFREQQAAEAAALESSRRELEGKHAEVISLHAMLDDREKELSQIQESSAETATSIAARELELTRRESALAGAAAERAAQQQQDVTTISELRAQLKQQREAAAATASALATRDAELARAVSALQAQKGTSGGENAKEAAELRARVKALEAVAGEYEELMRAHCQAWAGIRAEQMADASEAGAVIEALKGKLRASMQELNELKARGVAVAPAGAGGSGAPWMAGRRKRLAAIRTALWRRAGRIKKGEEALTKRFEQCEQILSQRAALAGVHQKIRAAERRHQRSSAGSRAVAVGLGGAATLAILAALSWATAREFAPAEFQAQAEVVAESRGRELSEGELAEWQRFHESLLMDPMYHESAAERCKRQSIEELSTPSQVAELLTKNASMESVRDGQLFIRLHGKGARQTERLLDTLTSALASYANSASSRRIDGGATRVSANAKAGDKPIDQTRSLWALVGFAASTVVSFSVIGIAYLRLSRAKTAFEQDTTIDETLDEGRWVDPRLTRD